MPAQGRHGHVELARGIFNWDKVATHNKRPVPVQARELSNPIGVGRVIDAAPARNADDARGQVYIQEPVASELRLRVSSHEFAAVPFPLYFFAGFICC